MVYCPLQLKIYSRTLLSELVDQRNAPGTVEVFIRLARVHATLGWLYASVANVDVEAADVLLTVKDPAPAAPPPTVKSANVHTYVLTALAVLNVAEMSAMAGTLHSNRQYAAGK